MTMTMPKVLICGKSPSSPRETVRLTIGANPSFGVRWVKAEQKSKLGAVAQVLVSPPTCFPSPWIHYMWAVCSSTGFRSLSSGQLNLAF
jgi:hypothetical protein